MANDKIIVRTIIIKEPMKQIYEESLINISAHHLSLAQKSFEQELSEIEVQISAQLGIVDISGFFDKKDKP